MVMEITLVVNGRETSVRIHPGETLLELVRRLGFTGAKDGCAHGDCGSCAVLLDGRAVTSCLVFAAQADGRFVRTVEDLGDLDGLDPLQQAFLDVGGVQCGFCIPGMLLSAVELLDRNPAPTEDEVRTALAGNLCRCTGYAKPVEAILVAAERMRGEAHG